MALPKKRRGFSFFHDIDEEFDRVRKGMEERMEEAFKNIPEHEGAKITSRGPIVYGFSMRVGPDGKLQFQEFGNTNPELRQAMPEGREPLIDVIEEEKTVTMIAELPGVNKEDIQLNATEEKLSIKVESEERKYAKDIALSCSIKPETAKANYKNGVLEVKFDRKEPVKTGAESTSIKIE